jgi:hypothetical protein
MKPTWSRRNRVSSSGEKLLVSVPPITTWPRVGTSRPAATLSSVDLPEPDWPITAVSEPRAKSRDTPRRAATGVAPS